jgi:hypothetical protein
MSIRRPKLFLFPSFIVDDESLSVQRMVFLLPTGLTVTVSEIEAVNVLFIKDERRAEPHLVIGNFDLTEPSGAQFFVASLERSRYQSVGRINR